MVLLGPGGRCCVLGREDADDAGGDFVVHDRLVVLAHNVDTKLDDIIRLQFERLGFCALGREPVAVDECSVRRLDVFDVYLYNIKRIMVISSQS